jgi:hypothetical protein
MRRFTILLVAAASLVLSLAVVSQSGAQGGGLSAGQLNSHGWTCFNVPGLGVHCSPPGQPWPPTKPHQQLLYFFHTTDPTSRVPDFTGTESLLRKDHFHGQPCPTEGGEYTDLTFLGLPDYLGCHRQLP